MKNLKILILTILTLSPIFALAQSANEVESVDSGRSKTEAIKSIFKKVMPEKENVSAEENTNSTPKLVGDIKNHKSKKKASEKSKEEELSLFWTVLLSLFLIYWVLGCFAILIHTPIVWFFTNRVKSYAKGVDFSENRRRLGLAESTLEENKKCSSLLDEGFADWGDNGIPKNLKAYRKAFKAIRQVVKIMPSDLEVCKQLKEKSKLLYNMAERSFTGSWLSLSIACFFSLVFIFSPLITIFMILSIILYIVASFSPNYILAEDDSVGFTIVNTSFWSGWSLEDGYTPFLSLFFLLIAGVIVGIFISFFAVTRYLKNYVFYS